jgi:ABC-type phosphate transport system ATPase subunit
MEKERQLPTHAASVSLPRPSGNGATTVGDEQDIEIQIRDACLFYGKKQALYNINMDIGRHEVTAFIGPSGCGKSTLLRCLNRLNDLVDGVKVTGSIKIDGRETIDPTLDVTELRKRVGMVFQKPNPFPKPFTKTSRTVPASLASVTKRDLMRLSNVAYAEALMGRSERPPPRQCLGSVRRPTSTSLHRSYHCG